MLAQRTLFEKAAAEPVNHRALLDGVRDMPARRRCATLPWEALREALDRR